MSYTMPGMVMYDVATDSPSYTASMPAVPAASNGAPSGTGGLFGNNSIGLSVGTSYNASADATGAIVLFVALWLATTGALHYFHTHGG